MALRKSAGFGGPVVHLGIDIDRVFAPPHGISILVPDPLKVKGLATGTASADHEISSEIKQP